MTSNHAWSPLTHTRVCICAEYTLGTYIILIIYLFNTYIILKHTHTYTYTCTHTQAHTYMHTYALIYVVSYTSWSLECKLTDMFKLKVLFAGIDDNNLTIFRFCFAMHLLQFYYFSKIEFKMKIKFIQSDTINLCYVDAVHLHVL